MRHILHTMYFFFLSSHSSNKIGFRKSKFNRNQQYKVLTIQFFVVYAVVAYVV